MPQGQDMKNMSDAVTRAAGMCEMMMKKEMAMMPVKMAVSATVVLLVIAALSLLVVLEIQWVKHWRHRLKTEGL